VIFRVFFMDKGIIRKELPLCQRIEEGGGAFDMIKGTGWIISRGFNDMRRKRDLGILGAMAAILLWGSLSCSSAPPPKPGGLGVGDQAFPFALSDSAGNILKLSDIQEGWTLVLVFYRGHWCSACLNQLLNLKEDYPKFAAAKVAVAAISADTIEDSAQFNREWRFPFPLLSDTKLEVIDAYGLRHRKEHEGKDISRPSIIILNPGRVVRYKHVGQNPTDRPTDNEILFEVQKIKK